MNLKERADRLKTDIPAVFLALKSRETPAAAKILAGVTVIYALSPIDLIPDFIPVLGYLDDVILLPALIALTIRFIPKETFERYRREVSEGRGMGIHGKWYYGIPVLLVWGLVLFLIIKWIWF